MTRTSNIVRLHRVVDLPAREHEGQHKVDLFEALRKRVSREPTLADDFREVIGEIRASPYSHALVAILTVVAWSVLLVAPLLLGLYQ